MAAIINDKAEERALAFLINKAGYTLRAVTLRLFKNDMTPAEDDVVGDYTEADFTGYSAAAVPSADWTISGTTPTLATAVTKNFVSGADQALQNIYGWFLTTDTDNDVVAAERFADAPLPIVNNGDFIPVTIQLTAANG